MLIVSILDVLNVIFSHTVLFMILIMRKAAEVLEGKKQKVYMTRIDPSPLHIGPKLLCLYKVKTTCIGNFFVVGHPIMPHRIYFFYYIDSPTYATDISE